MCYQYALNYHCRNRGKNSLSFIGLGPHFCSNLPPSVSVIMTSQRTYIPFNFSKSEIRVNFLKCLPGSECLFHLLDDFCAGNKKVKKVEQKGLKS